MLKQISGFHMCLIILCICNPFSVSAQPLATNNESRDDEKLYFLSAENCDRDVIVNDYFKYYEGNKVSTLELGWNGNIENCIPGTISDLALEKVKGTINYFRKLVGITNGVVFSEVKNAKCQKAVLMMNAAYKLDHFPTSDWKCSSPEGIEAAGKSNLSYGSHSSASVAQYIADAGSNNGAVGHRRWILYPKSYEFGFGSTNWGTAMWVIGGTQTPDSIPNFVAYPSPGYFPKNLIYPRWSFSIKGANFTNASIKMQNENGTNIAIKKEDVENGYGDNTLVWVPTINLYNNELGSDHYFQVTIDSVQINGVPNSFQYEVLGIDVFQNINNYEVKNSTCGESNGSIELSLPWGYNSILWSDGQINTLVMDQLEPGEYAVTITDKLDCEQVFVMKIETDSRIPEPPIIQGTINSTVGKIETYTTDLPEGHSVKWEIENGELIGNANENNIQVKWSGDENHGKVCVSMVSDIGCESPKSCIGVDLLISATTNFVEEKIIIFTNPITDLLKITNLGSNTKIAIFDAEGVLKAKYMSEGNEELQVIDVCTLDSGFYLLHLSSSSMSKTIKFIKMM